MGATRGAAESVHAAAAAAIEAIEAGNAIWAALAEATNIIVANPRAALERIDARGTVIQAAIGEAHLVGAFGDATAFVSGCAAIADGHALGAAADAARAITTATICADFARSPVASAAAATDPGVTDAPATL